MQMTSPGFNMNGPEATGAAESPDAATAALPATVAAVPAANPAAPAVAAATAPAETTEAAAAGAAATKPETPAVASVAAEAPAADALKTAAVAPAEPAKPGGEAKADAAAAPQPGQTIVTATDPDQVAAPIEPKKRGFLSAFFSTTPAAAAGRGENASPFAQIAASPKAQSGSSRAEPAVIKAKPSAIKSEPPADTAQKQERLVQLASASGEEAKSLAVRASVTGQFDALPGVRQTALFEIKRKSGLDDDSDVDLHEEEDGGPVELAYAAGMARLAPNGLLTQTESVDVACLKPSLVRVLKTIEQRYGHKIVVTSGYRSPAHNRRARGAKNSLHMFCAAADIQVQGVSKWELASFVRAMPGRGGVGTYCHTNSVHVDVGPERDWNWRCRRRQS